MKILVAGALTTEFLWAASLLFVPWNQNVFVFLSLFFAAFAVYLLVWRSVDKTNPGQRAAWWILGTGLLFRLTIFFSPPSLSDDIYRYLWDGRVQLAGINPYAHPPNGAPLASLRDRHFENINHKHIRTLYPPLSQWVFRTAARLSPTLAAQRIAFMLFDMGLMFLLLLYLRRKELPESRLLLYAWNPLVLVEFSSSGHLDAMSLFFLLAGLYALEFQKTLPAGTLWGLSFLGKLGSAILWPWVALKKFGRRTAGPFALAVAAGYLTFFLWPLEEIKTSLFSGTATYAKSWSFNASVYALFSAILPISAVWIKIFLFSGVGVTALILAHRLRNDQTALYAGLVWGLCILVSPVVHPWYATWLVPFLCFYPVWSGLAYTGLVALSYVVLHQYALSGVWELPLWVPWLEYGTVAVIGIFEWRRRHSLKTNRAEASSPLNACRATVIIPALNEEKALPAVLSEIPREDAPWVLVVDNGSTDNTPEAARRTGARVVRESRRGYGWAVLAGMANLQSDCNVVVVMDGDHSDYPDDLTSLLAPIKCGEADFVIGSRILGGAPRESLTPQQRFGNWLSCWLMRLFFRHNFTDLGPFRAIRRDVLESLKMEDTTFGWNVEMQIKAVRAGVRIAEVPVRYRRRIGVSKISGTVKGSFLAGIKILWTIFKFGIWAPSLPPFPHQSPKPAHF